MSWPGSRYSTSPVSDNMTRTVLRGPEYRTRPRLSTRMNSQLQLWAWAYRKTITEFFNAIGWFLRVQHRMTIWTYWSQIADGVNSILPADSREFNQMVDVDEFPTDHAILFFKIKFTDATLVTILFNAFAPCLFISFILIYSNLPGRTL
jgi:hypothetical protein